MLLIRWKVLYLKHLSQCLEYRCYLKIVVWLSVSGQHPHPEIYPNITTPWEAPQTLYPNSSESTLPPALWLPVVFSPDTHHHTPSAQMWSWAMCGCPELACTKDKKKEAACLPNLLCPISNRPDMLIRIFVWKETELSPHTHIFFLSGLHSAAPQSR